MSKNVELSSVLCIVILFGLITAGLCDRPFIEVIEWLQIRPYQIPLFREAGKVNGIRQCGGQGKLLGWRNEACSQGYPEPFLCPFPATQQLRGEIEFEPKEDAEELGVHMVVTAAGQVKEFKGLLSNSTVKGGQKYTMQGVGAPIPELAGHVMTTQFNVIRTSDNKKELCTEADFAVY